MLTRGHQLVEELFPGISEDWRWAGAEFLDIGMDFAWRTPKGWGVGARRESVCLPAAGP